MNFYCKYCHGLAEPSKVPSQIKQNGDMHPNPRHTQISIYFKSNSMKSERLPINGVAQLLVQPPLDCGMCRLVGRSVHRGHTRMYGVTRSLQQGCHLAEKFEVFGFAGESGNVCKNSV